MVFLMKLFIVLLFLLISVAFFTLLERSVLGYSHVRFGPNSVFIFGLFQPFSDALKLFSKEMLKLKDLNMGFYFFSPLFYIFISLFCWGFLLFWGVLYFSKYTIVFFILLIGVGVYFLLFSGWSSNSKFSLLGSCRSSAQSISYEVVMVFCILVMLFFWYVLGFLEYFYVSYELSFFFCVCLASICWLFSCLAECNRSPFDFSEGESELVSGFNTEYSGGLFSFIFIGEYSFILFLSFISSIFLLTFILTVFFFIFFSFFYLWIRSTFARLRYDCLMEISWKGLVFLVMSCFFFYLMLF